ncbi:guanitoxin biosynthesis heme-dependent pre-guanitoxin N-hydroxylase GntA [Legionella brunensis]|uniref:YqcI/YcgG family protein n=1 Tax=Legionella brunensis TaxID=29422 RepID=A0A0W0S3V6_9GAMM|nr:guanitoxin biosynthesis heme-dependent pre-guanitoxin N-hydroxylase GntA [Legionella brunensis]KTC78104.1 YqcI/YcgG family protein [Legionella brunensis]
MHDVERMFREKILAENFSCVGAKASINRLTYQFCLLDKMASDESTGELYQALQYFASARTTLDKHFASFIACFANHCNIKPEEFENLLWLQLQMLHEVDQFPWDKSVSKDVNNPRFSFSIAGQSYFIIGLCPNHPRKCRDFYYPTLVFNSHHQFNFLKQSQLFYKIQKTVRARELHYSGSINPNLIEFEGHSEALQYSGFKASLSKQCPFNFTSKEKESC